MTGPITKVLSRAGDGALDRPLGKLALDEDVDLVGQVVAGEPSASAWFDAKISITAASSPMWPSVTRLARPRAIVQADPSLTTLSAISSIFLVSSPPNLLKTVSSMDALWPRESFAPPRPVPACIIVRFSRPPKGRWLLRHLAGS
jgi:hypothetical protein